MPTTPNIYQLDLTGINPDNLIEDEEHLSIDYNTGIIIPEYKNFFTESLIIKNSDDEILNRNTDYIPIEFNQDASLQTGKEICTAIILLTNLDKTPIKLTYQVLGGVTSYSASNLIQSYIDKVPAEFPIEYDNIFDKPIEFTPRHHLHDADDIYGLEYIVNSLTRLQRAIELGSFTTYRQLLSFIDTAMIKIKQDMEEFLANNMQLELDEFKETITRLSLKIENINNLNYANEKEGLELGSPTFTGNQILENKYIVISSLIGFKRAIYSNLVRKDLTGIDLILSNYGIPTDYSLRDLGNRSMFIGMSKNNAKINQSNYSDNFYPHQLSPSNDVVVMKLSNSLISNDSDLLMFDQTNLEGYWGMLVETYQSIEINWKKFTNQNRLSTILNTLRAHTVDYGNPHELTKEQIQMDKVENLPVVTKTELDAAASVRSYLTFDTLLYFARKHFLQNGPASPVDPDSRNKFIIDNAVVVYSPAGKPTSDTTGVYNAVVTGLDGVFPTGRTIGYAINNGEPLSEFTVISGMLGSSRVTNTYKFDKNGNFIGYTQTGSVAGTIQSIFTFSNNKIVITNSLIQESACEEPPSPEPPAPSPEPEPEPPAPEPPAPTPMVMEPASTTISSENGVAVNHLAGQISGGIPTGTVVNLSGSLAPGLSVIVSTVAEFGSYPVRITGTPTTSGNFTATVRIIGQDDKSATLTVNCNIAAIKIPDLQISSNRTKVDNDQSETITVTASGGKPNSSITVKVYFKYLSGSYKVFDNTITISLDNNGNGTGSCPGGNPGRKKEAYQAPLPGGGWGATYTAYRYVGGIPLGNWERWAETVNTTPIKRSNSIQVKLYDSFSSLPSLSMG